MSDPERIRRSLEYNPEVNPGGPKVGFEESAPIEIALALGAECGRVTVDS
jgi:hypothetical protein